MRPECPLQQLSNSGDHLRVCRWHRSRQYDLYETLSFGREKEFLYACSDEYRVRGPFFSVHRCFPVEYATMIGRLLRIPGASVPRKAQFVVLLADDLAQEIQSSLPFMLVHYCPQVRNMNRTLLTETRPQDEILARLHRLENAVFTQSRSETSSKLSATSSPIPAPAVELPAYSCGVGNSPDAAAIGLQRSLMSPSDAFKHLPPRSETLRLFKIFRRTFNINFSICHEPSSLALIHDIYDQLSLNETSTWSHLAFVFSVITLGLLYDESRFRTGVIRPENAEQIGIWRQVADECIDIAWRSHELSTITLQAICIILYVEVNMGGFTPKFHLYCGIGIAAARMLQLDRLDSPKAIASRRNIDTADLELRRRIWWWMCSSDWFLAYMASEQMYTYHIQPKHFRVRLPHNIELDEIGDQATIREHPWSTYTSASYGLQRARIASILRETVDTLSENSLDPEEVNYEVVLALHSKYEAFMAEVPYFYRLDSNSLTQALPLTQQFPDLPHERTLIHLHYHAPLIRLHIPFWARVSQDPKYQFSRNVCLASAESILRLHAEGTTEDLSLGLHPALHSEFVFSILLTMDLCFNSKDVSASEKRQVDVQEACKALQNVRGSGDAQRLNRALAVLSRALKKHKETIGFPTPATENQTGSNTPAVPDQLTLMMGGPSNNAGPTSVPLGQVPTGLGQPNIIPPGVDYDFNNLWSEFMDIAPNLEGQDWSSLLSDLDFQVTVS